MVSFLKEIEAIPLQGHFFDMVGFYMPGNVVFLADCLSSRETLNKYVVSFIYDVGAYLETLDKVEQMEAVMFVPAHADVRLEGNYKDGHGLDCDLTFWAVQLNNLVAAA